MCNRRDRSPACFLAVLVVALFAGAAPALADAPPQFRAFWADVFHYGLQTPAQVDAMIAKAVQGRYNAILPEVLAFHDNQVGSHGAYWKSDIVARSPFVTEDFDPLAYIIEQAHANGLEVHAWLVAFRVSSLWPPPGHDMLAAHPEWLMVTRPAIGTVDKVDSYYTFDPGSPEVQEYLVSIVRELAANYEIDGIHWDYIRYTRNDAGYPTDLGYAQSSLARFQRLTGRSDVPAPSDAGWSDFRRRTISELIRRCRAEVAAIAGNPRQPLRHSAALISWGNAPADFAGSSAYGLFQNWELWMRMGWLDAACPMLYYREHLADQAQWYRNWVDAAVGWRYQRQVYPGIAVYLNTMSNSITQLQYAVAQGVDGLLTYSYGVTRSDGSDYDAWYPYVAANLFTETAATPSMPWRDPATAIEGTLYGRVTAADTGDPIEDATVAVEGMEPIRADGNGYYVITMIPAQGNGSSHTVNASFTGYAVVRVPAVSILPAGLHRLDLALDRPPVAQDGGAAAEAGKSVEVTLQATDDGQPDPPGALDFTITKLPDHGTLAEPGAGMIVAPGYILAGHGSKVVYTPSIHFSGTDRFRFKAADGRSESSEATVSIVVDGPRPDVAPAEVVLLVTQQGPGAVEGTFSVRNVGRGELAYTVTPSDVKWLQSVAPREGNSKGPDDKTTHTVTCSTSGLSNGLYMGQVLVASVEPEPGQAPFSLPVKVTVQIQPPPGDGDFDGLPDAQDNCPNVANTDQADADQDGVGDACDNCPLLPNTDQTDTDQDAVGDPCDNCPVGLNWSQSDRDGDGVGDVCDNCPNVANSVQTDTDANGIGDACDASPPPDDDGTSSEPPGGPDPGTDTPPGGNNGGTNPIEQPGGGPPDSGQQTPGDNNGASDSDTDRNQDGRGVLCGFGAVQVLPWSAFALMAMRLTGGLRARRRRS